MTDAPIILWFRRDLRLGDHAALAAAAATGRPVIPVFILDEVDATLGSAARWRLGLGLETFGNALQRIGSRLTLRRGRAAEVIEQLVGETGAGAVWWSRSHDPAARERDTAIKSALRARAIDARSFAGQLLFDPWDVGTQDGSFFRVYSPFWRAVANRDPGALLRPPDRLTTPASWPVSERIADWAPGAAMNRGARIVLPYQVIGEEAARGRLDRFMAERVEKYRRDRDFLAVPATSGLSENLAWGEISPRTVWHAALAAEATGAAGAEHFRKELVWREFGWHLMYHTPHIADRNWRADWDAFPWRPDNEDAERWRRGMTGEPLVDAAMRELYVTGRMHNRARMIAASYLTKHLLTDWRVGLAWFAECLTDWDPASNALGWQWVAGSGPDAAPYFRIFNPATQAERFDPDGAYRRRWIAEGQADPPATALSFFDAVPRQWGLSPGHGLPAPMIDLAAGRARALEAHAAMVAGRH